MSRLLWFGISVYVLNNGALQVKSQVTKAYYKSCMDLKLSLLYKSLYGFEIELKISYFSFEKLQ